jgi:hypothetical protein
MRFTTEEHATTHTEGQLVSAIDLPPALACDMGRFATIGTQLRTITKAHPEFNAEEYSASNDGLLLLVKRLTYVFKRRR